MATGTGWTPPYSVHTSTSNLNMVHNSGQTGKYIPSSAPGMFYEGSLTLEYTQDLHLKMSKKIAQLTKV